jgi:hypothetical protein
MEIDESREIARLGFISLLSFTTIKGQARITRGGETIIFERKGNAVGISLLTSGVSTKLTQDEAIAWLQTTKWMELSHLAPRHRPSLP